MLFLEVLHCRCLTRFRSCLRFWIAQGSMNQRFVYTRVLNLPLVLNMPGFSIYQSSEYARVTQGSEYAWIIPEYAWLYLDMSKYAWISRNVPESAWMAFVFHFSISPFLTIPFLLEHVVTYLNVYRRLEVIVWRNMRLLSWKEKIWLFYSRWKNLICFLF